MGNKYKPHPNYREITRFVSKIILIATFCLVSINAISQVRKVQNLPYADQKLYHFGFNIGMNIQDMPLTNTGVKQANGEVWFANIPSYSIGFNVGLIADYYLSEHFNLRFNPTIYFGEKSIVFVEENTEAQFKKSLKANYMLFPLQIKINGSRTDNYRPYLLAGAYSSISIGNKKNDVLKFNSIDYGLEFGVGITLYLQYFRLSPELRFSFGLRNIINKDRSDLSNTDLLKYSDAVNSGKNRFVSLIFNFE